jgi:hypothetical protein
MSPIVFTDLGGGKLQWKLPRVGTGAGTISFSVQVANNLPAGQQLINTAVIDSPLPDTDLADNTATNTTTVTSTSQADVGIAKALTSPPETFYTGRPAVYTLTYSNSGDLPAITIRHSSFRRPAQPTQQSHLRRAWGHGAPAIPTFRHPAIGTTGRR